MARILLALTLFPIVSFAQVSSPGVRYVSAAPSGSCAAAPPIQVVSSTGVGYVCNNGTWGQLGSGGAGGGTVNSGTLGQPSIYPASGTAVSSSGLFLDASQFSGGDFGAKVNACAAALPAAGGTCDARNFSSPVSMTTTVTPGSDSKPVRVILPSATINLSSGAQFDYYESTAYLGAGDTNNGYTSATVVHDTAAHSVFVYGGSSAAVGVNIEGMRSIDTTSGAVAVDFTATGYSHVSYVTTGADVGLLVGGTAACACYNVFTDMDNQDITYGAEFLVQANANQTFGGNYWSNSSGTGIYINGGSSNQFYSADMEGQATAINVAVGNNNTFIAPYMEADTHSIVLASGVTGNVVLGASGSAAGVEDSSGNTTNYYKLTGAAGNAGAWSPSDAVSSVLYWGSAIDGGYNDKLALTNSAGANPYLDLNQVGQNVTVYGFYGHAPLNVGNLGFTSGMSGKGQTAITTLSTPTAPTITQGGTPGNTSANYYVVCHDKTGGVTLPSSAGSTSTGSGSLSGTNYNIISWPAQDGCWLWDILKGNTTTSLAVNQHPAITGTTIAFNDTGQSTAGYTTPAYNSTADLQLGGLQVPTLAYSNAGKQLPACASAIAGAEAFVGDASALTPGTAYSVSAGAGTIKVRVQCAYSGSSYAWQTM